MNLRDTESPTRQTNRNLLDNSKIANSLFLIVTTSMHYVSIRIQSLRNRCPSARDYVRFNRSFFLANYVYCNCPQSFRNCICNFILNHYIPHLPIGRQAVHHLSSDYVLHECQRHHSFHRVCVDFVAHACRNADGRGIGDFLARSAVWKYYDVQYTGLHYFVRGCQHAWIHCYAMHV